MSRIYLSKSTELANLLYECQSNPLINKLRSQQIESDLKINYLDYKTQGNTLMFSYLPPDKPLKEGENIFEASSRMVVRAGRVLKRLFPDESDDTVRTAVEYLNSRIDKGDVSIFLVGGEEIRKYYQWPRAKCTCRFTKSAPLQSSCYQGIAFDWNFELIERNAERFKLVVCMVGEYLDGRALVLIGDNEVLLDNVTCNTAANRLKLREFLKTQYEYTESAIGFKMTGLVDGKPLHHFNTVGYKDGVLAKIDYRNYKGLSMDEKWYDNSAGPYYTNWVKPEE